MKLWNVILITTLVCIYSCESSFEDENELEVENVDLGDIETKTDIVSEISEQKSDVFYIVEEMPEYPGGSEALRKAISEKVNYPEEAIESNISGKVYITFVINEKGELDDAKVVRGVDPSLDKEALRVVNSLEDWTPGKQRGKAVKVAYTVPINFSLQ